MAGKEVCTMKISNTLSDGTVLEATMELIRVQYQSTLDEHWKFTDAAGHEHSYGTEAFHYPTLNEIYEDEPCAAHGEDPDYYPLSHYECMDCGEHITPGTKGPGEVCLPGHIDYRRYGWITVAPEDVQEL